MKTGFFAAAPPRQFAHRGASGTCPENTMLAFRTAVELGAQAFELDVHATADDTIVVLHDDTVDRTTDGTGDVRSMSLTEVRRLDAGHRFSPDGGRTFPYRGDGVRIPTLEEVLESFPDVPLILEIKQEEPPLEEELARLLHSTESGDRCLVFSLSQGPLDRFRRIAPDRTTGFGPDDVADFLRRLGAGRWEGYRPPGSAFAVPVRWHGTQIVSGPFVEAVGRHDLEAFVWTVNEPREMHALLDLGVDGLISDYPERLSRVVAERSER